MLLSIATAVALSSGLELEIIGLVKSEDAFVWVAFTEEVKLKLLLSLIPK